jgi:uncharacterized delta-60 repeat protein
MRTIAFVMALCGCSQILGLQPPSGGHDAAIDGSVDAGSSCAGDFTMMVTTPAPRVPIDGFDVLAVSVTPSAGFDCSVTLDIPSPPAGVTVTAGTIAAGSAAGTLTVRGDSTLSGTPTVMLDVVASAAQLHHEVTVTAVVTVAPGTLDPTFGAAGTGVAQLSLGTNGNVLVDLSVGSNDEITAVGTATSTTNIRGAVARLLGSGTFDASFDPTATMPGSELYTPDPGSPASASFASIARHLPSGLVAGGNGSNTGDSLFHPWLASINSDGSQPTSFGKNGNAFGSFSGSATPLIAVVALPGGGLVALEQDTAQNPQFTSVFELTSTGAAASGFAGGNAVLLDLVPPGHAALTVDANLAVYIIGPHTDSGGANDVAIERYTSAGVLDATFGSGGLVTAGMPGIDDVPQAIVIAAGGAILVAGVTNADFAVRRFLPDGTPDTTFGNNGVTAPLANNGALTVRDMVVQADGRILVAGNATGGTSPGPLVARYNADGSLDTTYGTNGVASIFLGVGGVIDGIDLQSNGDAIVCGGITPDTAGAGVVARIQF